jgi:AraC-like DNA-binding protein
MSKVFKSFISMLFISTVFSNFICAQIDIKPDSIFSFIDRMDKREYKYTMLKKAGEHFYMNRDYKNAFIFYSRALNTAKTDNEKADIHLKIGRNFVDSTDYSDAKTHLKKALFYISKLNNIKMYPETYDLLGMCYGLTNNLDSAVFAFKQGKKYNIELSDSIGLGQSLYNIGLAFHFKGLYDKAAENFIESADIRMKINDTTGYVTALTSVGEVFRIQEDYDNALKYYKEAVVQKKAIKDHQTLAYLYSEFALIYKNTNEFDLSLQYIDTAMTYCENIKYKRGIATLLTYKAGIYEKLDKYDKALAFYGSAHDQYDQIGFEIGLVQSAIAVARIYYKRNFYNKALVEINSVSDKADKNKLLDEQTQISDLKYKIYKSTGEIKKALFEADKLMLLKDSLFNINKEERIREIENEYQAEKKDNEILLLKTKDKLNAQIILKQRSRFFLFSILFAVLLISSTVILFIFIQRNRAYKALVKRNIEITKLEEQPLKKTEPNVISEEQRIIDDLLCLIEENRYFLNSSCTIDGLAKEIKTNRQYLSQIINKNFKSNFNSFINKYRIKEARKLLLDDNYNKYTIDAIGELCGFNNRATFNTAFKRSTGVTPAYFKKNKIVA